MQYDYLVFIGRFEPFHNGHHAVVARALKLARQVIVLVGSANKPRTMRNPWNASEREVMIRAAFPNDTARLVVRPLRDHLYNDPLWVGDVQRIVAEVTGGTPNPRIGVIGHHKDHSSYYLEMFPQWNQVSSVNVAGVSASDLREYLFAGGPGELGRDLLIKAAVPEPVFAMLGGFRDGPQYSQLVREHQFIKNYRKEWAAAPYEPTFVTVDAVVIHSGHVLLVRRRAEPGKGLWAFPGGFVDKNESLQAAVIRELREETGLKVPAPVLSGSIKSREVFDHPDRSLRGRTITHAYYFEFPSGELPPVEGGDDAEHAQWMAIGEAREMEEQFFEDHFHILEHFI
jgi:bifunctional NMN adenylyltransferase/nudix hydrolase